MQILHIFDIYDSNHLDIIESIDDAMEYLPVSCHRLCTRLTSDIIHLLKSWNIEQPGNIPAILLLSGLNHIYLYPDQFEDDKQLIGAILDFYGVEY